MAKPKINPKKAHKHGVDFQKIKRKIGRKLPPPKNATNTEIKSKSIVLPEQSVASEKAGLALSTKRLTLKELLHQTDHHNAKVRNDALVGAGQIMREHPAELELHKLTVIEKLRERIGDDDKLVRVTLYQLFKSVIFPGCAKDDQGPLVSLMMTSVFNAMTSLTIDVRLMAFKFFDLVIQYYPSSLSLYAAKILQNYEDILRRNQFLEDKSKLKSTLDGLVHCLSLLSINEREDYASEEEIPAHEILHAFEPEISRKPNGLTDIAKRLKDLLPILVGCFMDFMPAIHTTSQLDEQSRDCMQFLLQSIDFIVKLLHCWISESEPDSQDFPQCPKPDVSTHYPFLLPMILKKLWHIFPLNHGHYLSGKVDGQFDMLNTVITKIFFQLSNWNYSPSALLEKFLEFIIRSLDIEKQSGKMSAEKRLLPLIPVIPKIAMRISGDWRSRLLQAFTKAFKICSTESPLKLACLSAIEEMFDPEKSWIDLDAGYPALLDDQIDWMQELPSLLISLGNKNPLCSKAVLRLQLCIGKTAPMNSRFSKEFDKTQNCFKDFFSTHTGGAVAYGPFRSLAADIQELAICCLFYFSVMDSQILQSLVSLCDDLDPCMVFRILEVVQSAFRAGHIQVADYISFHVTLISRFRVHSVNDCPNMENDEKSRWKTFKSITSLVCTCLSQIGDGYLVLEMLEKIIVDKICSEIPVDNKCAFLRLLVTLDAEPSRLSEQSTLNISHALPQYLINIVSNGKGYDCGDDNTKRRQYYLLPSFHLFCSCKRLLNLVLTGIGNLVPDVSLSLSPAIDRSTRVRDIAIVLLDMYKDIRIRQILLSFNTEMETLLHKLLDILSCEGTNLSLEERHEIQSAYDQLIRAIANNEVSGPP